MINSQCAKWISSHIIMDKFYQLMSVPEHGGDLQCLPTKKAEMWQQRELVQRTSGPKSGPTGDHEWKEQRSRTMLLLWSFAKVEQCAHHSELEYMKNTQKVTYEKYVNI